MLSRTQARTGRAVKQEQELNSHNHVQAFLLVSVDPQLARILLVAHVGWGHHVGTPRTQRGFRTPLLLGLLVSIGVHVRHRVLVGVGGAAVGAMEGRSGQILPLFRRRDAAALVGGKQAGLLVYFVLRTNGPFSFILASD